ncbi:MAG: hypothetical protein ACE5NG_17580 [bacterium]
MSPKPEFWGKLAEEFEQALQHDLGQVRTRARPSAVTRTRGAPRIRGTTRATRVEEAAKEQKVVVVLDVPTEGPTITVEQLQEILQQQQPGRDLVFDIYRIVRNKHWATLEPKELNPDDKEYGRKYQRVLKNLKPEFAILAKGIERPEWCPENTRVIAV